MINQTSILAYQEISNDGTIAKQAFEILKFFRQEYPIPRSRNEVERLTNFKINAICGRVKELLDAEWLKKVSREIDPITKKWNDKLLINIDVISKLYK